MVVEGKNGKTIATLEACCASCGRIEKYECDVDETSMLLAYQVFGRGMGTLQEVFPKIPAWIRAGAIDEASNGFCICPACCD